MTDIRSIEQTLSDNLPWNQARIKFVARFLLAIFSARTVNLSTLATTFSGRARAIHSGPGSYQLESWGLSISTF